MNAVKRNHPVTMHTDVMCGICGKIYNDIRQPPDGQLIRSMCRALIHRGPDDEGIFLHEHVALGHRRLSIIDLSPAGRQPMANEDGSVHIVFNGEIYNYRELRDELEDRGHRFSSQTDTEVILHLYEEDGTDCLHRLRGMFAFALWDSRSRSLFLARDRLGKKPLFYSMTAGGFVFASELRALLCDPEVPRNIDPVALHYYLTYQYIPSPATIFTSVKKLPPAHYAVYRYGKLSVHRYWSVSYKNKVTFSHIQDYRDYFFDTFREAVRIRLRSDVPFGAFLSGGIDSSLVVAFMSSMLERPVKTFSIGFAEKEYDELGYARMIAKRFSTEHHEFVVTPDIQALLPKLVLQYGEPFADSSTVPTYYLAQMTRQQVTVALSGDGGDECFAGYPRYPDTVKGARLQHLLHRMGLPFVRNMLERFLDTHDHEGLIGRLQRAVRLFSGDVPRWYIRKISQFAAHEKQRIYTRSFAEKVAHIDAFDYLATLYTAADGETVLDRLLQVDLLSYLPEDLLVKIDIASMAHGLEVRSPFLDHEVVACAAALPASLKLKDGETKYFLKATCASFVPKEILQRPKMGFGVPIDRWLRHELYPLVCDVLLDKTAQERGYFDVRAVRQLLAEHRDGRSNHCFRIWNLLWLELWHRIFIDSTMEAEAA
ncbi:MAG: asparagine synthase (glutamine-hydrolyzing) [Desulfobacterota bacterium]|nr:asparagine synthase (glutamine-hydrolyzing) [Thermodesulfobacteriota bacterium]